MKSRGVNLLSVFSLVLISCGVNAQVEKKFRVVAFSNQGAGIFSVSNEAEVFPEMTFYIPNAFTPNGDGINDTVGVIGEAIANFSLAIYNRWGQVMFESTNVKHQWDGTYKGYKVINGSYFYRVTAQGSKGAKQIRTGSIELIQ